MKVVASLALVDLAMRHPARIVAVGGAALTAAYSLVLPEGDGVGGLIYRLVIVVGAPVLLGAFLQSARESARQARLTAAAELARQDALVAEARREQRTAIARELHDIVAHHLASMVIRVGVARHAIPEVDPRVASVLDDVHRGAGTALADLRRLVGVLRETPDDGSPLPVEPAELPDALRDLAERARADGVDLTFTVDDQVAGLEALQAVTVLRLVQEGLTNVLKHAGPGVPARLEVTAADGVQVELTNETRKPVAVSNGYGLVGLDERVALVGGTFQAGPTPDGWRLAAQLPVVRARDEAVL